VHQGRQAMTAVTLVSVGGFRHRAEGKQVELLRPEQSLAFGRCRTRPVGRARRRECRACRGCSGVPHKPHTCSLAPTTGSESRKRTS
jgi:hypothetical protein